MNITRDEIVEKSAKKTAENAIEKFVKKISFERNLQKEIYNNEVKKMHIVQKQIDNLNEIYDKFYSFECIKKRTPYEIRLTYNDLYYSLDTSYKELELSFSWNEIKKLEQDILKEADNLLEKRIGKIDSNTYRSLTLYKTDLQVNLYLVDKFANNKTYMSDIHNVYMFFDSKQKDKIQFESYYATNCYRKYRKINKIIDAHRTKCIYNCKLKYERMVKEKQFEMGKSFFKRNTIAGFNTKEGYNDSITFESKSGNIRAMTYFTKNKKFDAKNPIPNNVSINLNKCTYEQFKKILATINEVL